MAGFLCIVVSALMATQVPQTVPVVVLPDSKSEHLVLRPTEDTTCLRLNIIGKVPARDGWRPVIAQSSSQGIALISVNEEGKSSLDVYAVTGSALTPVETNVESSMGFHVIWSQDREILIDWDKVEPGEREKGGIKVVREKWSPASRLSSYYATYEWVGQKLLSFIEKLNLKLVGTPFQRINMSKRFLPLNTSHLGTMDHAFKRAVLPVIQGDSVAVNLYDLATSKLIKTLSNEVPESLAISQDLVFIVGKITNNGLAPIRVYSATTGLPLATLSGFCAG